VDLRIGEALVAGALVGAVLGTTLTLDVLTKDGFKVFFAALLFFLACALVHD